ncbi:MAG: redoxin family protein [Pseudomonadota bacterium]
MNHRRLMVWLPLALAVLLAAGFTVALTKPQNNLAIMTNQAVLLDLPIPPFALAEAAAEGVDGSPHYDQIRGLADGDLVAGSSGLALVNFFASWCAPCRIEHPFLMRLARDASVPLYGIAYRDTGIKAAAYLVDAGNPFAQVGLDPDGDAALGFGITGMPETFLIDADGRIRFRVQGPVSGPQFDQLVTIIDQLRQEAG